VDAPRQAVGLDEHDRVWHRAVVAAGRLVDGRLHKRSVGQSDIGALQGEHGRPVPAPRCFQLGRLGLQRAQRLVDAELFEVCWARSHDRQRAPVRTTRTCEPAT
jgi:hypothetical protein